MRKFSIHRDSPNIIKYGNSHPFCITENQNSVEGHRFSNIVKIVLFISDVQHYVLIKLCKTSGSLHLFKITGTLTSEDIKLNKNYLWNALEINWDKIKLAFNSNEIKLPKLVTIKMQDKIRVRRMMSREMQNFHIMVKLGMTW